MSNQSWLRLLQRAMAIAVIRTPKVAQGEQMARAVAAGGMQIIEITWNSDRPQHLVSKLRAELPECLIGAGTLLSLEDLDEAIAAGAQFLFSPHVDPSMIQAATARNIPIVPGALSPTEIVTAWTLGASCVKVFPVAAMGGVNYIKSLQAPLGHIPLIPTGGVTLSTAKDFITAGAIAVGLSHDLFPQDLMTFGNWDAIAQLAQSLIQELRSM